MAIALCHVWRADLALYRPKHEDFLDREEAVRASTFRWAEDRRRFVLGAVLLRATVAQRIGGTPATVRVDRCCETCHAAHGRPRITGSDLHVSVAHAGSMVLVALSDQAPLGVDVEVRHATRRLPPSRQVLSEKEPTTGSDDLLTYWCRKESVLKATGAGLRVPLREVVVAPADQPARLLSYRDRQLDATMADLDLGSNFVAALSILTTQSIQIEICEAAPVLGWLRRCATDPP